MRKTLVFIVVVIACLAGASIFYENQTATPNDDQALTELRKKQTKPTQRSHERICDTSAREGRYLTYSSQLLDENKSDCPSYPTTILFFYAPWCPECRGFDKAILADDLPKGVQILKVDYDSSSDLKKRYGVTLQTTFVRIASNGDKLRAWTGYGEDKSVDLILENTR